jgi:hypothetical protein
MLKAQFRELVPLVHEVVDRAFAQRERQQQLFARSQPCNDTSGGSNDKSITTSESSTRFGVVDKNPSISSAASVNLHKPGSLITNPLGPRSPHSTKVTSSASEVS